MDTTYYAQLIVSGVSTGAIYAAVGMGFVLVFRVTGLLNFAQGDLLMVGGMLLISFREGGWPLWSAVIATIVLTAALGATLYLLAIAPAQRRATHVSLMLITLGLSQVLQGAAQLVWGEQPRYTDPFTPTERPLSLFGLVVSTQTLWIVGGVVVALGATYVVLERTGIGRAVRASAIDPTMARLLGVRVSLVCLVAFGAAGALSAIGGLLLAPMIGVGTATGSVLGVKGIAAAVVGGMGSIPGAVVGGIGLGVLESLASAASSGLQTTISLVAVIVVLLVLPNGLVGGRRRTAAVGV